MRRRRALYFVLAIAAVGALLARMAFVNARAERLDVRTHEVGESVNLDGSFLEYANESTEGYSIRVIGVRIMSTREYAEAYATVENPNERLATVAQTMGAGESEGEAALDEKTEIVLDVEVTNEGNRDGYLMALSWRIIPNRTRDVAFQPDFSLWSLASPAMGEQIGFTIREGTSMRLQIPFKRDIVRPPLKPNGCSYVAIAESEPYYLQVSNVPVRNIVELGAPAED